MTKLSVNINKFATLRNARGGNLPDILKVAQDCERFGADGITVHPRPDERHIRYQDVRDLKPLVTTEFNIEGYPSKDFMDLVLAVKPHQCTLVPDPPDAITSNTGWDTIAHQSQLREVIGTLKKAGIRVSIFLNPDVSKVEEPTVLNYTPALTPKSIRMHVHNRKTCSSSTIIKTPLKKLPLLAWTSMQDMTSISITSDSSSSTFPS